MRIPRFALPCAALIYTAVLAGNALTRAPWVDEAYIANPAWNLAFHSSIGTTSIEMARSPWTRIDRHTYNTLPVGILTLAAFYKLFGFSLAVTRLPSILCSFVLLASVYLLLRSLRAGRDLAALATAVLALDYNFMTAATFARVDMMCAALGFASFATYSAFRTKNPGRAVLLSCSLAILSVLTHPNGIVFAAGLLVMEALLFKMTIRWQSAVLVVIPFAIASACWLAYVAIDSEAAVNQLRSNAYPGRLTGFLHPSAAIYNEIKNRYLPAFGLTLGDHPSGPVRARAAILAAYLAALVFSLSVRPLRSTPWVKVSTTLLGLFTLYLTFFEGTRFTYYIVLVTPFYCVLLAAVLRHAWQRGQRRAAAAILICLATLQLGGVVYRSLQNPYRNSMSPAVAFLRQQQASEHDLIFANSDFAFSFGFDRNVKEEITLGYRSGVRPRFIVVDPNMSAVMKEWQTREPERYAFMNDRLNRYSKIYDSNGYRIYRERLPESPLPESR